MEQGGSRIVAFVVGVAVLSGTRATHALESCNQIEVAPGSEASVSVLLPDIAGDLQPKLTVRNASTSGSVDSWGTCPTMEPYGACTPATHGDVATVSARKIVDPGDGKRLLGFRLKNGAKAARDVRLCVQYGTQ